jgi:hypothetical protein
MAMSEFEGRRGQIREQLNRQQPISVDDALFLARAIDRLEAMVRERVTQVGQLKDHLREIQWSGEEGIRSYCPACGGWENTGHDPECWLWLAIRGA